MQGDAIDHLRHRRAVPARTASGGTHSIRADFCNVRDQGTLDGLVRDCFHAQRDCGHFKGDSPGR